MLRNLFVVLAFYIHQDLLAIICKQTKISQQQQQ